MPKLCNSQAIFLTKTKGADRDEPKGWGKGGRRRSYADEEDEFRSFGGRSKGKGRGKDRDRDYWEAPPRRSAKGGRKGAKPAKGNGKVRNLKVTKKGSGKGRSKKGGGGGGGEGKGSRKRKAEDPEVSKEDLDTALDDYFTGNTTAKKAKTTETKNGKSEKGEKALDDELDKYMGESKEKQEYTSKAKGQSAGILKDADEPGEKKEEKTEEKKEDAK
eukprot:TRINITY_DN74887_c0_g1_i1.p1 TRINITY_DN74887_c0_g1~~TRINITY_DN74887_c0_g1_i1.p1  ORF type:complete len:217 (-),score=102.20 TRINITY_DN74887_c0_g1_i1:118-768(-)